MELLAALALSGVLILSWKVYKLSVTISLLGESLLHLHIQYAKDHGTEMFDIRTGEKIDDPTDQQ